MALALFFPIPVKGQRLNGYPAAGRPFPGCGMQDPPVHAYMVYGIGAGKAFFSQLPFPAHAGVIQGEYLPFQFKDTVLTLFP